MFEFGLSYQTVQPVSVGSVLGRVRRSGSTCIGSPHPSALLGLFATFFVALTCHADNVCQSNLCM